MEIVNNIAPEKSRNIASDDKPWFTEPLKTLDKKRRREFNKNRRSERYFRLQKEFKSKCAHSKKKFFNDMVSQVKDSDPSRWYSLLKRISNYDKEKTEELQIDEIGHLSDQEQSEAIADSFDKIGKEYKEIRKEDIEIPNIEDQSYPTFAPWQVKKHFDKVKTNKSTLPGDIPAQIVKNCSQALCIPMSHMINHSIKTGMWPDSYKFETITPIGKQHPVEFLEQLRPISNLPISDKIQESIISELVISDMKEKT